MTDEDIKALRESHGELMEALGRIIRRSTPHIDDTDEDRQRDIFHIDEIARNALTRARALRERIDNG